MDESVVMDERRRVEPVAGVSELRAENPEVRRHPVGMGCQPQRVLQRCERTWSGEHPTDPARAWHRRRCGSFRPGGSANRSPVPYPVNGLLPAISSRHPGSLRHRRGPYRPCNEQFTFLQGPRVPPDSDASERDLRNRAPGRGDGAHTGPTGVRPPSPRSGVPSSRE